MKGILFNLETGMLKAVISGDKTMTRRLGGLEYINKKPDDWKPYYTYDENDTIIFKPKVGNLASIVTPRYKTNEIVFVKESCTECADGMGSPIMAYKVDNKRYYLGTNNERLGESTTEWSLDNYPGEGKWGNAMFCGENNARYFLKINSIKIERLKSISRTDAAKEGCCFKGEKPKWVQTHRFPEENFATLIDIINSKHTWEKNPWVWVYEFERVEKPIILKEEGLQKGLEDELTKEENGTGNSI